MLLKHLIDRMPRSTESIIEVPAPHIAMSTSPPHSPSSSSSDIDCIHSWIDTELLSFLQAHYDVPIEALDTLAKEVSELMDHFEDIENDEITVARIVHAAINRREISAPKSSLSAEQLDSYVYIAAILVDYRERHHDATIEELQRLG